MAQFYLNIRTGEHLIRDPNAYHFPTAQAARDAALQSLRQMLRDHPEQFDDKAIEIADATGHAVSVVNVYDAMPVRWN